MRVVVIGGGPAGVSAALHAAELGAEVTLVERGRVGGTALNSGPAPVRTLARAARLVRDWTSWETFGLRGPRPEVDVAATLANAQQVAGYLYERKRVADHIRSVGVDLIEEAGDARFVDANTVAAADGRKWSADRVIIAVGGKPGRLPIPGAELALTYEDLRSLTSLPDRVCVIGAADTGCQLTSILADFGCQVTLVEYAHRIVPRADVDVSAGLEHAFRGRGIEVITSAAVHQLEALQPRCARPVPSRRNLTADGRVGQETRRVGSPRPQSPALRRDRPMGLLRPELQPRRPRFLRPTPHRRRPSPPSAPSPRQPPRRHPARLPTSPNPLRRTQSLGTPPKQPRQ